MHQPFSEHLQSQLAELHNAGLYKHEREIASPQAAHIQVGGHTLINLCANNYLGLANHPQLLEAAHEGLEERGFGMASVRFICGTQDIHRQLEHRLSAFVGQEDAILYSSCFDANTGLFETLFDERDAIISDALNHASIIDGIRLCKAQRLRYANCDMKALEECLKDAKDARYRVIATDGVFSMDGIIANLPDICDLAERYDALVMLDDSHALGFVGEHGKGTAEYHGVTEQVDIITGTLGKAMGGASGGFTAAAKPITDWLRQRSRPYLFSNSLAPAIVNASLEALNLLESSYDLRTRLMDNSHYFRERMLQAGFQLAGADHPIIPVMIGDAPLTVKLADRLLHAGIYVIGFSYPVVPQGQARIRTQMSADHSREDLDRAIEAFTHCGHHLKLI